MEGDPWRDGYLIEKTTPEGPTAYVYGTLGELIRVTKPDGTVIEYLHNANNQRVAKQVNGTITEKYLWGDLTTLLAVYDQDDNLITRFEYADGRMPYKMRHNGQTYYLAYDHVGTPKAVIRNDGTIVKEVSYDTYGQVLSDSNASLVIPFGFAGGLYDVDTQLARFGYRDYDAFTGKWTAKDPIGFAGGDANLYGYVLGDPVGLVDPEGLWISYYSGKTYSTSAVQPQILSDVHAMQPGEKYYYQAGSYNNPNYIVVTAHGFFELFDTLFQPLTTPMSPQIDGYNTTNLHILINLIENTPKAQANPCPNNQNHPCMPIQLAACNVGLSNIPQLIANATGRQVYAYLGWFFPTLGFGIGQVIYYPK